MDVPPQFRTAGVLALLEQQAGLISAAQLRTVGLDPRIARRWVATGRWQRPHQGVFAAFSGPLDRTAQIWAATPAWNSTAGSDTTATGGSAIAVATMRAR